MRKTILSKKLLSLALVLIMIASFLPITDFILTAKASSNFGLPLLQGNIITFGFGAYSSSQGKYHLGIDYGNSGNVATDVLAIADGEVYSTFKTANSGGWGNLVIIKHKTVDEKYYYSGYGHMVENSVCVSVGDKVSCGTKLGVMGSTGNSTGPHVHLFVCTGISSTSTIPSGYTTSSFSGTATKNGITYYNPSTVISTNGTCIYGTETENSTQPTTPPVGSLNIRSAKTVYNSSESITFNWDSLVTATEYWVYMWKDGVQLYSNNRGNNTDFTSAPTSPGNYTFIVRAGNSAGFNGGESFSFIVTDSAPEGALDIRSAKNVYSSSESISFNWNALTTATEYWAYMWKDGVQLYSNNRGNNTDFTSAPTSPGKYTFIVRAGNSAGFNGGESFSFIVTDSAPSAPIINVDKTSATVGEDITITWTGSENTSHYWLSCWSSKEQVLSQKVFGNSFSFTLPYVDTFEITISAVNSIGEVQGNCLHISIICKNHNWNNGTITTASTCTVSGLKTFTCTVCGTTKTESIEKAAHTPEVIKGIAATCTAPGKTDAMVCRECGAVITASQTILPKGHRDDNSDGFCDDCAALLAEQHETGTKCVCGKYHTGTLAPLIRFFHSIIYFFRNMQIGG